MPCPWVGSGVQDGRLAFVACVWQCVRHGLLLTSVLAVVLVD